MHTTGRKTAKRPTCFSMSRTHDTRNNAEKECFARSEVNHSGRRTFIFLEKGRRR